MAPPNTPNNPQELFMRLPPDLQKRLVKRLQELKAKFSAQDREKKKEQEKFLQLLTNKDGRKSR